MYQAFYRKYRPRRFCDVTGQDHITQTLRRQIVLGRLSHAYLFVGTRGTGKTTCAKILSRAVNCMALEDGEPCNKCISCVGIDNGSILDVLELVAASNNGVDSVRALRDEAIYTPAAVAKRVYIIDEVHMLSTPAFNALLKILEEPPEHLLFVLATTELHKVPPTIMSRCQRFSFKRISPSSIAERLLLVAEKEGLSLSAEAAERLAALSDGSMRDGLSLLDQCASDPVVDLPRVLEMLGLAGQKSILQLACAVAERDTSVALESLDRLYDDGKDLPALLNELLVLWRDILVFKLSADAPLLSGVFERSELSALSQKLAPDRLLSFLEIIREAVFGLSRGGVTRISAEMCLIRMCNGNSECGMRNAELKSEKGAESNSEFGIRNSELENASTTKPQIRAEELRPVIENPASVSGETVDSRVENEQQESIDKPYLDNSEFRIPNSESAPEFRIPNSELEAEADGFWHDMLDCLKHDVPVYMLLSDSSNVQARQQDGAIIISTGNPFTAAQIETKMFSEPLKEAARKVFGHDVSIRVETGVGGDTEDKRGKLDSLSAFGIVQFE